MSICGGADAVGPVSLPHMQIRRVNPEDAVAVADLVSLAFADDGAVARLWRDVVTRGLARAELVATDGARLVGHVGLSHAWLDTRASLVNVLVLSPLSVDPDRQCEGIGTRLVATALATATALAAPLVFVEGSPAYYGERGFEPASAHGFDSPTRRIPGPAFQVARLPGHSPSTTGRVVYRDVWWEHDAVGLRDPQLSALEATYGVVDPG